MMSEIVGKGYEEDLNEAGKVNKRYSKLFRVIMHQVLVCIA